MVAVAAALGTAALAPAGPAAASRSRAKLALVGQSEWSTPGSPGGTAPFDLTLRASGAGPGAKVRVAVYTRLRTRFGFEQTVRSGPAGSPLDEITPVDLSQLAPDSHFPGSVDLGTTVATTATRVAGPSLDLGCGPPTGAGTCTGVYPVVVSLVGADGTTLDRFTTFLTYAVAKSAHPLELAWVAPVSAPVTVRTGATSPARIVAPLPRRQARPIEGLVGALRATPSVPVTLAPSPQTLAALAASGPAGRAAVASVAAMSDNQAVDEVLPEPYVPVDLSALGGSAVRSEIAAQMAEGGRVLAGSGIRTTASPGIWVANRPAGAGFATGLAEARAGRVVVPDADLTSPAGSANSATWASTFPLAIGKSTTVPAAASDGALTTELSDVHADPALAASRFLADLAMVHFERPNTTAVRGLVAVPPAGWTPEGAFDRVLLAGLEANPDVTPVTLSTYFATVAESDTRHLARTGSGTAMGRGLVRALGAARGRLEAFRSAVDGRPRILGQLNQVLLVAEDGHLQPRSQLATVGAFRRALRAQLSLIGFAAEKTVTLTARTGWIPITVVSDAHYTVRGRLSVTSDKLVLPRSACKAAETVTPDCRMTLDHATNPVRVDVHARSSGELPLKVAFTSPKGGLVIATGQLSVRSTATSIAGVVLTALALFVLLVWWARTWWSGRRKRSGAAG